jgi:polysaccharide export outer membrane protein
MKTSIYIFIFLVFASCSTKKDVHYFQDAVNQVENEISSINNFKFLKIQPGDILDIQIKASNPETVLIFERKNNLVESQKQSADRAIDGYLVGEDNTISLPTLGSINTSNHSTSSLARKIEQVLSPYVTNPSVNIRLLNFRFTVLGEVQNPGTFNVYDENVSLIQAIGMAKDLTINGDRENILLVRHQNKKKINYSIDITKSDFMNSPVNYLKQNDVIYIRPNTAAVKKSGIVDGTSTLTSVLSLAISLFIVITR